MEAVGYFFVFLFFFFLFAVLYVYAHTCEYVYIYECVYFLLAGTHDEAHAAAECFGSAYVHTPQGTKARTPS